MVGERREQLLNDRRDLGGLAILAQRHVVRLLGELLVEIETCRNAALGYGFSVPRRQGTA